MAYSSVNAMLNVSRQNNQPLWDVILQSDLLESGLTRPQSLAEMHHLWQVMVQTSDNYCGADRSASGFAGGDAAKVAEAEARGQLLTGGYLAQVMAEALKTAECNACMKRIVAAPTAGSCGVLPAVLLPLWRSGSYNEEAICRALYVSAGFGQVVAARATLEIFVFILVFSFIIGLIFGFVGADSAAAFLGSLGIFQPMMAALIGLVPNCGASVLLAQLYMGGAITFGSFFAGLCSGAGIGLAVLWRVNPSWKQNLFMTGLLWFCGTCCGILLQWVV